MLTFNAKKNEILKRQTLKEIYKNDDNKKIRKAISGKDQFPDMTNVATH